MPYKAGIRPFHSAHGVANMTAIRILPTHHGIGLCLDQYSLDNTALSVPRHHRLASYSHGKTRLRKAYNRFVLITNRLSPSKSRPSNYGTMPTKDNRASALAAQAAPALSTCAR